MPKITQTQRQEGPYKMSKHLNSVVTWEEKGMKKKKKNGKNDRTV